MLNPLRTSLTVFLCCSFQIPLCFSKSELEAYASDWQLRTDNDALVSTVRDRNYTGGITFAQSGRRAAERVFSLDGWLGRFDSLFNIGDNTFTNTRHSMQFGLVVFTPERISKKEPIFDDHPYSNLIFLANSRQWLSEDKNSVSRSMLLLGLFGTNTAKMIQSGLHSLIDVEEANGWDNQISDGGEPTFRYSLSKTRFLKSNYNKAFTAYDISTTLEGNAGYTTDINAGLSLRIGKIHALGWYSLPDPSDYFTAAYAPLITHEGKRDSEMFFLAGVNARLRIYNVLLQGQFRHSEVTYAYSDLNPLIGEAWIGAGAAFSNGWQASFVVRGRTREFEAEQSVRQVWGGLTIIRVW
ncbi:MAG: lipid A deacylase LpxR family protein [bacterium]|nr:lipid A deacylase LpxR family protein [Gammaproteobacteria bacterium]HIL98857.1 lipid A deacylase LpxR family protein [Pseudomonadales bacterium]